MKRMSFEIGYGERATFYLRRSLGFGASTRLSWNNR
jgi:hypothetical protein